MACHFGQRGGAQHATHERASHADENRAPCTCSSSRKTAPKRRCGILHSTRCKNTHTNTASLLARTSEGPTHGREVRRVERRVLRGERKTKHNETTATEKRPPSTQTVGIATPLFSTRIRAPYGKHRNARNPLRACTRTNATHLMASVTRTKPPFWPGTCPLMNRRSRRGSIFAVHFARA